MRNLNWKSYFAACLLGMLATLALPPFGYVLALCPALVGWLWLGRNCPSAKKQSALAWCWGLGHYATSLYWIPLALTADLKMFGWLIPIALIAIPATLALYPALLGAIYQKLRRGSALDIITFSLLWTLMEWLKGVLFTGFPWNIIGYSWYNFLPVMQAVSLIGIYGLTFFTILLFTLPFLWLQKVKHRHNLSYAVLAIFIGICGFGLWRLHANQTEFTPIVVRLIQGNIQPSLTSSAENKRLILQQYNKLTTMHTPMSHSTPQIVIWPEAAFPYPLTTPLKAQPGISKLIPTHSLLITGALRVELNAANHYDWFNSIVTYQADGEPVGYYDKQLLVPFGEFVPFRWFKPIAWVAQGVDDVGRGSKDRSLKLPPPFAHAAPFVCYEIIFPGLDFAPDASWLLNVTNDGWYGNSSGPYQHLVQAQVRAIETGLPLVRAANTGISAIFDPSGRTIIRSQFGEETVVESYLPKPAKPFKSSLRE